MGVTFRTDLGAAMEMLEQSFTLLFPAVAWAGRSWSCPVTAPARATKTALGLGSRAPGSSSALAELLYVLCGAGVSSSERSTWVCYFKHDLC